MVSRAGSILRNSNARSQRLYTGGCALFNVKISDHFGSVVVDTGIQRCSQPCFSRFATHRITHQVWGQFLVLLQTRTGLQWPIGGESLSSSRRLFLLELVDGRVLLGMSGRLNGSCVDIDYRISILDR